MRIRRSFTKAWFPYSRSMCGSMLITLTTGTNDRALPRPCCQKSSIGNSSRRTLMGRASNAPISKAREPARLSLLLKPVPGAEHPGDHCHAKCDDRHRDCDAGPDGDVGD